VRRGWSPTWEAAAAKVAKAPLQSSATAVPVFDPVAPQKVTAVSHGERAVTLLIATRVDEEVR
jgi:hypothetical protein